MDRTIAVIRKMLAVGGWAPLLVFLIHALATLVFHVYRIWPQADIPMHFAGGLAIAFFISGCFRALPRDAVRTSRLVVLEVILVGTLSTTAAVVWEFAEFALDQTIGSNIQVSLANTMQDLALGMLGAAVFVVIRARQLRAGHAEVRHVIREWFAGPGQISLTAPAMDRASHTSRSLG